MVVARQLPQRDRCRPVVSVMDLLNNSQSTDAASGLASPSSARSRKNLRAVLLMLVLIGAFYLLREHWERVSGRWAYLLLLVCPLVHLFWHGGHRR